MIEVSLGFIIAVALGSAAATFMITYTWCQETIIEHNRKEDKRS